MRLRRVYSAEPLAGGGQASLSGAAARHIIKVLRLRPGDELVLFDGRGGEYPARLASNRGDHVELTLGEHYQREVESALPLSLVQGVSRGDRMDTIVQKATELGARTIVPVVTEYSVVKIDAERTHRRLEHWQRIAHSACEQSGRHAPPSISEPQPLERGLEALSQTGTRLALDPAAELTFANGSSPERRATPVCLLVGPEGGLSERDLLLADRAGFERVKLGPRILRVETAAIAACTIAQANWGDLLEP